MNVSPNYSTEAAIRAFQMLLERFSMQAASEGVFIEPYHGASPPWFAFLPDAEQEATLANFSRYMDACMATVRDGKRLHHDKALLWRMFQRLGVRPVADFLHQVDDEDIIEIYDQNFVQVFRNLRFFNVCSYSLDELLCRPFWELFKREASVTQIIVEQGAKLFSGHQSDTSVVTTGVHTIDEIHSPMLYHSVVENKLLSPLFDIKSGVVVAAASTIRGISCESRRPSTRRPMHDNGDRGLTLEMGRALIDH